MARLTPIVLKSQDHEAFPNFPMDALVGLMRAVGGRASWDEYDQGLQPNENLIIYRYIDPESNAQRFTLVLEDGSEAGLRDGNDR